MAIREKVSIEGKIAKTFEPFFPLLINCEPDYTGEYRRTFKRIFETSDGRFVEVILELPSDLYYSNDAILEQDVIDLPPGTSISITRWNNVEVFPSCIQHSNDDLMRIVKESEGEWNFTTVLLENPDTFCHNLNRFSDLNTNKGSKNAMFSRMMGLVSDVDLGTPSSRFH
jgi:hypothetical protein